MGTTNETLKQPGGSAGYISESDMKYAEALYDGIYDAIGKDGECFEKKITGIPSGAIVVCIACIILKGSGLICLPIGIIGASLLLLCLITNMLSCFFGKRTKERYANILRRHIERSIPTDLYGIAGKINRGVNIWNWISVILLFPGMILTAIFIFINI
jgi:hypothetical protein